MKSSTVKDANGTKFKTSSAGVVTEVDGTSDDGSDEARNSGGTDVLGGLIKKLGVFSTEIKFLHGNIFLWINRSFFYIKGVITHRKKKLLFFLKNIDFS